MEAGESRPAFGHGSKLPLRSAAFPVRISPKSPFKLFLPVPFLELPLLFPLGRTGLPEHHRIYNAAHRP
jgi:hypothetical protein